MAEQAASAGALRDTITIAEAARRTAWSRSFVYQLIGRGEVEAVKYGRSVRIYVDSLAAFQARNRV